MPPERESEGTTPQIRPDIDNAVIPRLMLTRYGLPRSIDRISLCRGPEEPIDRSECPGQLSIDWRAVLFLCKALMNSIDLFRALHQPDRAGIHYLDRFSPDRPLVLECF